jgi:hypothetical protein
MEALPKELPNDLDVLPAFDTKEWIGTGKIFSLSKNPLHVLIKKQKQIVIPDTHLHHFPPVALPATKFIELPLPIHSTEIIMTTPKIWFSKDSPCTDVICL